MSGGDDITIVCNHIGTNLAGTAAASISNGSQGIYLGYDVRNLQIGGSTFADANVLSGNGSEGVSGQWGTGMKIQGNFIGTDITGLVAIGNGEEGIDIW